MIEIALVLWFGFFTPAQCLERIDAAVASQQLRWLMEVPAAPVPKSCYYLLEDWQRQVLGLEPYTDR